METEHRVLIAQGVIYETILIKYDETNCWDNADSIKFMNKKKDEGWILPEKVSRYAVKNKEVVIHKYTCEEAN